MKLHYDPCQIFRSSNTPAGLYARQKWLGESGTQQWLQDFQECVSTLLADQSSGGSWHGDPLATINRLFGLHLTQRSSTRQIDGALDWLLGGIEITQEGLVIRHKVGDVADTDLKGLPFVWSRSDILLTSATLFLCSIFSRQKDPSVLKLYRWLCDHSGVWMQDSRSLHNVLRALVVHPVFTRDSVVKTAVDRLVDCQTEIGDWGDDYPFCQTVNALAHLNLPQAERQLEKAVRRLIDIQKSNGTFGSDEPEWNTFLCVHALRNKGILK